jgi:uncharacterized protein YggT (Ycf19 family)
MSSNPFSDETVKARAEIYPPMDELQPKVQPLQAQQPPEVIETPLVPELQEEQEEQRKARTTKFAIGKLNDYLTWFIMVLQTMLALRFLLKLVGASPDNAFAGFLYAVTSILLIPFSGIVGSPQIHGPDQVVEFSTLIGMLVYYLIYYALKRFFHLLISRPEDPAAE